MTPEEQLEWESRAGRIAGATALVSALLLAGGLIWGRAILGNASDNVENLVAIHKHQGPTVAAAVIGALGVLLVTPVLVYLFRVTRYRRPELPPIALVLAIAAPAVSAVLSVIAQVEAVHGANKLAKELPLPPNVANDRADHFLAPVQHLALVGWPVGAALGAALIMISLNAMRAGVLSRFMGVLGIVAGALYLVPFLGGPAIIEFFWLVALTVLFFNRWPGGRGPAWEAGEAIPWPSAAEQRQRMQEAAGAAEPAEPAAVVGGAATPSEHPRSKKRKRKRRR